jgi:hypothetical protein
MRKLWRNAPVHRRAADDRAGLEQFARIVGGTYTASDESGDAKESVRRRWPGGAERGDARFYSCRRVCCAS